MWSDQQLERGDEDDLIHSFKKVQPTESGLQMLKEEATNQETEENTEEDDKDPEMKDIEDAEAEVIIPRYGEALRNFNQAYIKKTLSAAPLSYLLLQRT